MATLTTRAEGGAAPCAEPVGAPSSPPPFPGPVAVVGAGTIGRSVAHALAAAGQQVLLVDVSTGVLDASMARLRQDLRFERLLGGGAGRGRVDATVLARIEPTTRDERLAEAGFVIENTTEDWDVKRGVYRRLDQVCRPQAVFAANTSCVPITRIAAQTGRPEQVLGMHFMNPVPVKPVVEMVRGFHTSPGTIDVARRLLAGMGKEGILVEDSPGFVANRVMMLAVNEAAYLVHERVAEPADVDRIFTSCFGHPMGMLATADLIGLDTILYSIEQLHDRFADSKYRPCPLLRQLVDAGHLGRKSGRGFFRYA
ncbi:3-hydroxybutyryl-CoA dehydrogenase [Streptacidiphilus sp. MAP12-20]|uniref:3-hydroxyacyl-CoA dehydrogenase family protein n=1 Tax=Streptacidiphilus sp. MAP12-20 TaxID=3156299 RepID=UPI003518D644